MNILTRLVSLLLMLCMVFGCYPANADTEVTEATEQTATTTVVLDLGTQPTSYTIVIPSTVTLGSDGTGSATITLESGFVLTDVTSLYVRMTDGYTSGSEPYVVLNNTENGSTLKCYMKKIYNGSTVANITSTDNLIGVTNQSNNSKDYTAKIGFEVEQNLPSYGVYTGTLTFTVVTAA